METRTSNLNTHSMRRLLVTLVFLFVSVLSVSNAAGQDCEHYDCEKEPKRIALVIGNANYANLEPIPSAATDAEQMSRRLTDLKFDVEVHNDVRTSFEFWNEIVPAFRQKLTTGDFVVFYFSGHGFSYGSESFVAPSELPLSMTVQNVTDHAIAVGSFKDKLESHSPALILFIIDACRSTGALLSGISGANNENLIGKGPASMQNPNPASPVNTIIAFATEPGHVALGSGLAGQPSPFTGVLTGHLLTEGSPFSAVFKDAAAELVISTNPPQVPGTFDWSRTDPYLRPTEQILASEKEAWLSALRSGAWTNVKVFVQRYSVSRFLRAGRKWLADHPSNNLASGFTRASPIAIDRAWRPTNSEMVAIRRLSVPLGFTRSISEDDKHDLRAVSDSEIGLVRSGISSNELAQLRTGEKFVASISPRNELRTDFYRNSLAYSLASIDAHGTMVATRHLVGRVEPRLSANVVEQIPASTVLQVTDVSVKTDESVWIQAIGAGSLTPFYFKLEAGMTPQVLELGHSAKEILVPVRPGSIPELVDPTRIKSAIAELKAEGWRITWISLATGATTDEVEQETRDARMANAEYILRHSDVPVFTSKGNNSDIGDRITSVSGRQDLTGSEVRIRFFGIK